MAQDIEQLVAEYIQVERRFSEILRAVIDSIEDDDVEAIV